jgi:serine/threonine protein kinase
MSGSVATTFKCPHCQKEHPLSEKTCPEKKEDIHVVYRLHGSILEGKYEVLRVVGEGGMGMVYEGRNKTIGRRVAIKCLYPDLKVTQEAAARFHNEAMLTASIAHKNIIEVFDMGTIEGGVPYIVMEYLDGTSLAKMLELGPLSEATAVDVCLEILSALKAVHSKGIIHRDLKPENVFIMEQSGGEQIVKVLDFGISYLAKPIEGASILKTKTGIVMGTPHYMSPEQARGKKSIDHRADLYSLGIMLYEMVTGQLPFKGDNYNEVIIAITVEEPPPPSFHYDAIPPELEKVIMKAIDKDPDKRYQNASEFTSALMPFVKVREEGTLSSSIRVLVRGARAAEPATPAGVEAAARQVGGVQGDHLTLQGIHTASSTGVPDRKRSRWLVPLTIVSLLLLVATGGFIVYRVMGGGDTEPAEPKGKQEPATKVDEGPPTWEVTLTGRHPRRAAAQARGEGRAEHDPGRGRGVRGLGEIRFRRVRRHDPRGHASLGLDDRCRGGRGRRGDRRPVEEDQEGQEDRPASRPGPASGQGGHEGRGEDGHEAHRQGKD